jgi:hypothetical protein
MYWQVYLHKTSTAAEIMLINILRRAKELSSRGEKLFGPPALLYFLSREITLSDFNNSPEALDNFALLDDSDILCAIKAWSNHTDLVLSTLCHDFSNRKLFKVEILTDKDRGEALQKQFLKDYQQHIGISEYEAGYFLGVETVSTDTYSPEDDTIDILQKDGTVKDIAEASDMLNIQVLTKKVEKHFLCYYRL